MNGRFSNVKDLIISAHGIIDLLIVIVFSIALLVFLWGLAKFIFRVGGDENAVDEGKRIMLWGIISLFVMVSVWGLVNFLVDAFGFNTTSGPLPGQLTPPGNNQNPTPIPWYDPEGGFGI